MSVAIAGVIAFSLLLAINWMICRSAAYPGVALAGIWLLEFITQVFARGVLYPVSWYALGSWWLPAQGNLAWLVRKTRVKIILQR